MTAKERIEAVAAELGITMVATFVPWSLSRNAGEKHSSLNWKVTLRRNGRDILITDYAAGCGHCPSYRQGRQTIASQAVLRHECETGFPAVFVDGFSRAARIPGRKPILPELASVLSSLVSDASAIDYNCFEDWASDMGYDTDSRSAEAIYRACLETGLKLRNALGESGLAALREACIDY